MCTDKGEEDTMKWHSIMLNGLLFSFESCFVSSTHKKIPFSQLIKQ